MSDERPPESSPPPEEQEQAAPAPDESPFPQPEVVPEKKSLDDPTDIGYRDG